jgi:hypothetical protein
MRVDVDRECGAGGAARFARGWGERSARKQTPRDHLVFVFAQTSRPMHRPQAGAPARALCVSQQIALFVLCSFVSAVKKLSAIPVVSVLINP